MTQHITIGVDLAKNVIYICVITSNQKLILSKELSRVKFKEFLANHKPALVAFEACATAHYWSRFAKSLGHETKILPALSVAPFRQGHKTDKNDALAVAEAANRPCTKCFTFSTLGSLNTNITNLMKETDKDSLLFDFFTEIGIIEQLARSQLENTMPGDIKISQFVVLNHLVRVENTWSPARLASALQVTKPAITNNLQRLESLGLIEITADPNDGRAKVVKLTKTGRQVREQCILSIQPFLIDMEQKLGRKEFQEVLPFLQIVRIFMDNFRDNKPPTALEQTVKLG